ncbi:MAG: thiamine pyrophosphate-dependent enzyme [Candidatus Bathyarchaeota archaeon]|jgi:pyruvate/2-oxoacid:ferredoxin oxidoreductase beta subunit|nr:thiamine pyrophosphate-dependent enzyme [Candidatus Bathyarchaeota archaeon]
MSQRINRFQIPMEEITITPGSACSGCGASLAARLVFKAIGPNAIRHRIPSCPDAVTSHPMASSVFEGGGAMLTGTWRALKAIGRTDVQVVGLFGDGGTYDIGFQGISAAAERNENVWVIVKDNEAYMNTGNQRSGSTPIFSYTSTTPVGSVIKGKQMRKKNIAKIFAAHGIPYLATASVAYPEDLISKINYGKTVEGFKMLIIHAPCPVGWRFDEAKTIEIARLVVQTGIWPLFEIIDGERFKLNYKPRELKPVTEYLKPQARFRHLTDDNISVIQEETAKEWVTLLKSEELGRVLL